MTEFKGVHSLDHFTLAAPDLATGEQFYKTFGLDVRREGDNLGVYAADGHRWMILKPGPAKKLLSLTFAVFPGEIGAFADHLKAAGVATISPPPGEPQDGVWFANPEGLAFQVIEAAKVSPDAKSDFAHPHIAGSGVQSAYGRSKAQLVNPRRLSHMAIFTKDVLGSIAFYEKSLGLRLSDRSRDIVAFLHGPHGSDHHMLALVTSDGPGFHHCSWDVGSIEEVGLGAAQVAAAYNGPGWGLGRHVLGSNYFNYIRDPWGSYAEYSAGMDYIGADDQWTAGDHDPEDSMSLWGPNPPEDFVKNYETAGAN